MKRWRTGLLGVMVSTLAIYFIVSQIDLGHFRDALQTAHYGYVLPALLLLLVGLGTRALRWRVLLNDKLSIDRTFHILNVSYLVNGLLPLRAGEFARAYLASRGESSVQVATSLSTIVVERLLDLLAVLVLIGFALASGPLPDELRTAGMVAAPLTVIGFLVLVLLAHRRNWAHSVMSWAVARVKVLAKLKPTALLDQFLDGLLPLTRPATLAQALWWTVASWGFSVAAGYVLMLAFFERADLAATALFIASASFAIAVPAVPGNVGTFELSVLVALEASGWGDPTSRASAFAGVLHGINLIVFALMGTIGLMHEGVSLAQLNIGVRQMRARTVTEAVRTDGVQRE